VALHVGIRGADHIDIGSETRDLYPATAGSGIRTGGYGLGFGHPTRRPMDSTFKDAIRDHLQLKERNRWIEDSMPLSHYRSAVLDPEVESEDGAGEPDSATQGDILDPDGPSGWPTAEALGLEVPDALWSGQPAFDWGD
jgi:hypothetical protein